MTDAEADAFAPPEERNHGELRAVLDTNVPIAAHLSRNPHSPTIELLARWRGGQFVQRNVINAAHGLRPRMSNDA